MYSDENNYDGWIAQFKGIVKVEDQLKFMLVILYSVEGKAQKIFHDRIIKFERYLSNAKLMRDIKHRDSLIVEFPVEYFGNDIGQNDMFAYKTDLEVRISKITLEIMATLGNVIKHEKGKEFNIGTDI